MSGPCLTEETILRFRELSPGDRLTAEAHAAACDECRQLLSLEARSGDAVDAAYAPTVNVHTAVDSPALVHAGGGADSVRVGSVLAGKYRVDGVLGSGGMGIVVSAMHLQLGQRVALKFLQARAAIDSGVVERFLREARAAVRLRSEHVARVIDVGTLEGGSPYIVMEYLEGVDLSRVLKDRKQVPIAEAIEFVVQASEAIAEAHGAGVIHRDIKPGNLFLTARADGTPLVKVLDFGISKFDNPNGNATTADVAMGSPRYMSPEQMQSARDVDQRTDVWALGVVLYELLAGRPPFDSDSFVNLCAMVATSAPPSLSELVSGLPVDLERAIFAALEKDLTRRTATVAEFAESLRAFATEETQRGIDRVHRVAKSPLRMSVPPPVVSAVAESATDDGVSRTGSSGRRGSGVLFLVALVLLVAGAGAFAVFGRSPEVSPASRSSASITVPVAETPATGVKEALEITDLSHNPASPTASASASSAPVPKAPAVVAPRPNSPSTRPAERGRDSTGLSDRK